MSNSSKLSLNIILHVTILFTILYLLFKFYISKLVSKLINTELGHIIKSGIESNLYISEGVPKPISITIPRPNETETNNITIMISTLIQNEINKLINNSPEIKDLKDKNIVLYGQLTRTTDNIIKQTIELNISDINLQINDNIKKIIKSLDFDFYINKFKKHDSFKELFNNYLFESIGIVNILLVIFLVFFIFISLKNENLTVSDVSHIFIENIITFIFVGIIEVWFFMNVASKFIPAPPSNIFTSLFASLKKLFE